MSSADASYGFAVLAGFCALVSLAGAGLALKLYTEFVKEKKYREP